MRLVWTNLGMAEAHGGAGWGTALTHSGGAVLILPTNAEVHEPLLTVGSCVARFATKGGQVEQMPYGKTLRLNRMQLSGGHEAPHASQPSTSHSTMASWVMGVGSSPPEQCSSLRTNARESPQELMRTYRFTSQSSSWDSTQKWSHC